MNDRGYLFQPLGVACERAPNNPQTIPLPDFDIPALNENDELFNAILKQYNLNKETICCKAKLIKYLRGEKVYMH